MTCLKDILGMGYSGYAELNGVPILLTPSNVTENDNPVVTNNSYSNEVALANGPLVAAGVRSLDVSLNFLISKRSLELIKDMTFGSWRTNLGITTAGSATLRLFAGTGSGYLMDLYVESVALKADPMSLISGTVTGTSWYWRDLPYDPSKIKIGNTKTLFENADDRPIAGWQSWVTTPMMLDSTVLSWSVTLQNNWNFEHFCGGYTNPTTPGVVSLGELSTSLNISWLAPYDRKPQGIGDATVYFGLNGNPSYYINLQNLYRTNSRNISGIGEMNTYLKWETSYSNTKGKPV